MTTKIDHLTEDIVDAKQAYFLFSYHLTKDPEMPAMFKVRGFKSSLDDAEKYAKHLTKVDPNHHVYVCETGKWGGLLTPEKMKELAESDTSVRQNYSEDKMQEIMKNHNEKTQEAKEYDEKRRKLMSQTSSTRKLEINDLKATNNNLNQDISRMREQIKELEKEDDDELKQVVLKDLNEKISNNLFIIKSNESKIEESQKQLKFQKYME